MNNENIHIFIMAGGVGSRFWPKSRNQFPKQFIDIMGTGASLLQLTAQRMLPIVKYANISVVTHEAYTHLVEKQLPQLPKENILCEPERKNTAPCIAYAAFKLYSRNPDATMVIVPSDHLILKEGEYLRKIKEACQFAAVNEGLVTLGIKPTRPDTGYGYINYDNDPTSTTEVSGVHKVLSFKEKPDSATALAYLKEGHYLWNAGMFIWKVSAIIDEIKRHAPAMFDLFKNGIRYMNTAYETEYIKAVYNQVENISIDFLIMEKSENVYTIPSDIAWSDLGTWNSLYDVHQHRDANDNVTMAKNIIIKESKDCMVCASDNKLIAIKGLDNYIIVDDKNVLLIYPKSEEQGIKELLIDIQQNGYSEYL